MLYAVVGERCLLVFSLQLNTGWSDVTDKIALCSGPLRSPIRVGGADRTWPAPQPSSAAARALRPPARGGGRTAPCRMSRISLLLRLCPRCKCALCSFRLQSRCTVCGSLHYVPRRVDCHARISRVEISSLLINLAWPASEARTVLDRRQTGAMQHAV